MSNKYSLGLKPKGKKCLIDTRPDGRVLMKLGLKYVGFLRNVLIWPNIVTLVSFREHSNETSVCKKGGQIIDYVNHY